MNLSCLRTFEFRISLGTSLLLTRVKLWDMFSVFIFTCYADTLRDFMVTAHALGMTSGDYAMIYYRSFVGDSFGDQSWRRGDNKDHVSLIIVLCV